MIGEKIAIAKGVVAIITPITVNDTSFLMACILYILLVSNITLMSVACLFMTTRLTCSYQSIVIIILLFINAVQPVFTTHLCGVEHFNQ